MVPNHRLFILGPDGHIIIRNNAGQEVSFDSVAQFAAHAGVNSDVITDDVITMGYEPKIGPSRIEYADPDNPGMDPWSDAYYESIINRVPELALTREDDFFDVSLEEAKQIKTNHILAAAFTAKREEYEEGTNRLSPTGLQSLEEISAHAQLAKLKGSSGWSINVILANTGANGLPKRININADQVINFVANIYARNESINQAAQDEIDFIQGMVSVDAIKNRPIPTF